QLLAGMCVPHFHLCRGSSCQTLSVPTEGHADDRVAALPREGEEILASIRIPHLHCPPIAGQAFAIRAKGYAPAILNVGEEFLAGLDIPDLPTAGQTFAVRAEGHAHEPAARRPLERPKFLAGFHIPHLHYSVFRSTGQELAVLA